MHCTYITASQVIFETGDFLTYYDQIGRDLEATQHRERAIRFVRGYAYRLETINEIRHFLGQSQEAVNYGIRILFTRILVDREWQPNYTVLLLLGYCLPYISSLPCCPICGLTHGIWCDDRTHS